MHHKFLQSMVSMGLVAQAVLHDCMSDLTTAAPVAVIDGPLLVNETEVLVISCNATGIPPPNVTWMFVRSGNNLTDAVSITSGSGRYTIDTDDPQAQEDKNMLVKSTLMVNNTNMNDTGTYSCRASNFLNGSTETVNVTVQCKQLHH